MALSVWRLVWEEVERMGECNCELTPSANGRWPRGECREEASDGETGAASVPVGVDPWVTRFSPYTQ